MKIISVILLTSLLTIIFRLAGYFIPIPRNKYSDKFLEAIPISVLVVLFFPDIFVSIGYTLAEISIAIIAMISIVYMTIKKMDLGRIIIISVSIAIILNCILNILRR